MGYHSFNHNHAPYKRQPTIFRAARYRSVSASKVSAKRGGIRAQDPLVRDATVAPILIGAGWAPGLVWAHAENL